jgi:hypothetical protein
LSGAARTDGHGRRTGDRGMRRVEPRRGADFPGGVFSGTPILWDVFQPHGRKRPNRRYKKRQPPPQSLHPPHLWNQIFMFFSGNSPIETPQRTQPYRSRSTFTRVPRCQAGAQASCPQTPVCLLACLWRRCPAGRPDPLRRTHPAPYKPTQTSSQRPTSSREGEWLLTYSDRLTPRIDLAPP